MVALVEQGDHFELVPERGERLVEASPGDARSQAHDHHVARLGAHGGREVGAIVVVLPIEAAREAARLQPPHLHAAAQVVGGRGQTGVGRHVQVPLARPLVTSAQIEPRNTLQMITIAKARKQRTHCSSSTSFIRYKIANISNIGR